MFVLGIFVLLSLLIDNQTFTLNSNLLPCVDNAVTASTYNYGFKFKDGVKQANEYTYDNNGNLTKDLNAGVSSIQYNCLNLPQRIDFSAGGFAQYGYTMDGVKRRKQYMPEPGSRSPVTIAYCENVVYEESEARILLTEEGYVTLDDGKYHYYLQDHQGNNRVVISENGTVEETNHYYPFGGMFAGTNSIQPYKYNGKEMNARKELKWYDYGARHYDAALGRFHTNDRFAEKYPSLSTYQYGADNPIGNIDVNGDTIIVAPNPNGLLDKISMSLGYDTKYQRAVNADLQQLKKDDKDVAKMIIELEQSSNIHTIDMPSKDGDNSSAFTDSKAKDKIPQGSFIKYNPYKRKDINGKERTPRVGLSHELRHSYDADKGLVTTDVTDNGIPMMEVRAINTENKIRNKIGEPKRTTYGNKKIPKELLH